MDGGATPAGRAQAIRDLNWSCDGAYLFAWHEATQRFTAKRADNGHTLHSATLGGLAALVRADRAADPVVYLSAALSAALGGGARL